MARKQLKRQDQVLYMTLTKPSSTLEKLKKDFSRQTTTVPMLRSLPVQCLKMLVQVTRMRNPGLSDEAELRGTFLKVPNLNWHKFME